MSLPTWLVARLQNPPPYRWDHRLRDYVPRSSFRYPIGKEPVLQASPFYVEGPGGDPRSQPILAAGEHGGNPQVPHQGGIGYPVLSSQQQEDTVMAAPQRGSNSGSWHEELRSAHLDVARVADRLERIVERLVGPSPSFRKDEDAVPGSGAIFDQVLQRSKGIQSAKARIETALDNLEAMLPPEAEGAQTGGAEQTQ